MRLGVLDVGSNTVHLLVVDAHHGAAPLPAHSHKTEMRLAEHLVDAREHCARQRAIGSRCDLCWRLGQSRKYRIQGVHLGLQGRHGCRARFRIMASQNLFERQCAGLHGDRTQGCGGSLEFVQPSFGGFKLPCGKLVSKEMRIVAMDSGKLPQ